MTGRRSKAAKKAEAHDREEAQQRAAEEAKLSDLWQDVAEKRAQAHLTLQFVGDLIHVKEHGLDGDGLTSAVEVALAELTLEIRAYVEAFHAADSAETALFVADEPEEEAEPAGEDLPVTQPVGVA